MSTYAVLEEAERRLVSWAGTLEEADLGRPTPCAGWDVRALLSHTLAGIEAFAASADGGPGPTAGDMFGGQDRLDGDPAGAAKRATGRSQAAWAALADPDAELTTVLGPLPAGQAMAISAFATAVHCWDLAAATGQPVTEMPDGLLGHAGAVAHQIVPGLRDGGDHSLFGPEVQAPGDATPTERLMAFLGRARQA